MKRTIQALTVAPLLIAAMPQSSGVSKFDAEQIAETTFQRIVEIESYSNGLNLSIDEDMGLDGARREHTIYLTRRSLSKVHNQQELEGLFAVLISFSSGESLAPAPNKHPNLTDYLGALAFEAAGQAVDPIDPTDPDDAHRREYTLPGVVAPRSEAGTSRGRAALRLISMSGSCSGATLSIIDRLQTEYRTLQVRDRPPLSDIATGIRKQFGALAMPPDNSCI